MPVSANTNETYSVRTIREDLQEAYISISPTETPFQASVGRRSLENTLYEWPVVELAAAVSTNRVMEGENTPGNDAPTNALRLSNYTQISDKVVEVSDTNNAVNGVSDIQKTAKQVALKMKELKRDMELMCLTPVIGAAGASGTARSSASLPAFLRTNTARGAGGTNPTLSGTTNGFPNALGTDGTLRALTETLFRNVISLCWGEGAEPKIALCGSGIKQKISTTFTGSATRFKQAEDKKVVGAIDVYISDFGELQIVPTRFIRSRDLFVLDPTYARLGFLQTMKQRELARTGHAERRMLSVEWGIQIDNEKAHGAVFDIDPAL